MYKPEMHPEKSRFLMTVRNLHFKSAPKMIPLPVTVREPAPLFPCGAQSRKGEPPSNLSRSAEGNWCVWQFGMLVSLTFTYQACCPMG